MSGGPALAASRVGDRISHAAQILATESEALLGVALGAVSAVAHTAGALAAAIGAGASTASGHLTIATSAVLPITLNGVVTDGSPNTFLGLPALPAALSILHNVACAQHTENPIRKGSATVFANGMRLSRQTDETTCGAILVDGLATVLVGGATLDAVPPNPLASVAAGVQGAAASVSAAISAGAGAVESAVRFGEGLVTTALAQAGAVVDQVEASVHVVEGEIAARVGALAGALESGVLGPLFGALLGDKSLAK